MPGPDRASPTGITPKSREKTQKSREKTPKSGEKKQKSREKILLLLKDHPQYSAKKLADAIGITEKGVEKQLSKLKAEGLLKRIGPDKGGECIVL